MPNPEHLAKLKEGVHAWNAWRRAHPDIEPDLKKADLSEARLARAFLRRTNLSKADLSNADLTRVDLRRAYAVGADLSGADLTGADLSGANLRGARLVGAKLSRADLSGAKLSAANLRGARLTDARLNETVFANTILSRTKGLDSCHHLGPSTVDHRTLANSDHLPLAFLTGVGLPVEMIRAYQGGDSITIEFTRARWGHLTPIEYALRVTLGSAYIVVKDADRIVVKLDSPEQFQAALDAVIPVLVALETVSPGESKSLSIESQEGTPEQIENEQLMAVLLYLVSRFEEEHAPSKLTPGQEAMVEAVKGGVRGVLGHALEKLFEARGKTEHQIYLRFKPAFESLKGVTDLPALKDEPPKQLSPASEDDT